MVTSDSCTLVHRPSALSSVSCPAHMRIARRTTEQMAHLDPLIHQRIRDDPPVAAPPQRLGAGTVARRQPHLRKLDVRLGEVVALGQQRFVCRLGGGVGDTVSEVQSRRMPRLAEPPPR